MKMHLGHIQILYGFGTDNYLWNRWFNSEKLKKVNELVAACLVRKEDFFKVNGYGLRVKYVNEDWNFWLKLISEGCYPVHMSFYGIWYRRKDVGELAKANENKKESLKIINSTASTIKKEVQAIQYPKQDYNNEDITKEVSSIKLSEIVDNKANILIFTKWLIDDEEYRNLAEFINKINKDKYNIIILLTEPKVNTLRNFVEKSAAVYDLTSFLDQKYWISFINYIMKKEKINIVLNINSNFGYQTLPYIKSKYPELQVSNYNNVKELLEVEEALNISNYNDALTDIDNQIKSYFNTNKSTYEKSCTEYIQNTYGNIYNAKIELLRDRLWSIPLWRWFIKTIKKTRNR